MEDEKTFGAVLNACDRGQKWEVAVQVLKQMLLDSILPGLISYNSLVSACERSSAWPAALAVLSTLEERRLEADAAGLGPAIRACAKSSEAQKAGRRELLSAWAARWSSFGRA